MNDKRFTEGSIARAFRNGDTDHIIAALADEGEPVIRVADAQQITEFRCEAVMHCGPGHQSVARCERKDPHGLDEEHQVYEVRFEWYSAEAYE